MKAAAVLLLLAGATPLSKGSAASPCEGNLRIDSSSLKIVDSCGRQRTFRGANVVAKSPPYYPSPVYQPGQSLAPTDGQLWASLGFNLVRLGTMWSGAQPVGRGQFDAGYLQTLVNISSTMYEYGVYTLVDAHQDLGSAYFCADGMPPWLAAEYSQGAPTFPEPLAPACNRSSPLSPPDCCGLYSWATFYFTNAVGRAFQTLYNTTKGQADGSAFWSAVVSAFVGPQGAGGAGGPAVLAWELLNEPWPGDVLSLPDLLLPGVGDRLNLQPWYFNVTAAIRAAEAAVGASPKIAQYESVTYDDFFPVGFDALPGAAEGLAQVSWHYYKLPNFSPDIQIASRAADAARLHAGAMLTEFDLALEHPVNAPYTEADMRHMLDLCDAHGQSYIGWAYGDMFNGTQLYPDVSREMARPLPIAIAGVNASYGFVANGSATIGPSFTLNYTLSSSISPVDAPTVVFLSTQLWFTTNLAVAVTSQPAGAVTWQIEWHNLTATTAPVETEGIPPPGPFAYAHLLVTATGTSSTAAVSVSVTADPPS